MDLKSAIAAYQEKENLNVVMRIMEDAETIDFLKNPTRNYRTVEGNEVSISLAYPHEYISYRIRAIREKAVKHAYHIRKPASWAYDELNRQLSIIQIDVGFTIPFEPIDWSGYILTFEITTGLLAWLESSLEEILLLYDSHCSEFDKKCFLRAFEAVKGIENAAHRKEAKIRAEVKDDEQTDV